MIAVTKRVSNYVACILTIVLVGMLAFNSPIDLNNIDTTHVIAFLGLLVLVLAFAVVAIVCDQVMSSYQNDQIVSLQNSVAEMKQQINDLSQPQNTPIMRTQEELVG